MIVLFVSYPSIVRGEIIPTSTSLQYYNALLIVINLGPLYGLHDFNAVILVPADDRLNKRSEFAGCTFETSPSLPRDSVKTFARHTEIIIQSSSATISGGDSGNHALEFPVAYASDLMLASSQFR